MSPRLQPKLIHGSLKPIFPITIAMISSRWDNAGKANKSLSNKLLDTVRPTVPLKNKIDVAQKKLDIQISKLDSIHAKLQKKHDMIFERIVTAQKGHNTSYAKAYATELSQIRKMKTMVSNAKLSMEQIQLRLNTVSDLGDVVVTLSPCMSIVKGLGSSIGEIMPGANASMQDLSSVLNDVMNSSSVSGVDTSIADMYNTDGGDVSGDANAILEEAQSMIESQTKSTIPDIPLNLPRTIKNSSQALI